MLQRGHTFHQHFKSDLKLLFLIRSCNVHYERYTPQALQSSSVAGVCQATLPSAFPNGNGRSRPETHSVYLHRAKSSRLNNSVDSSYSPFRVLRHPSDGSHCRWKKSISFESARQRSTSSCHQAASCSVQCNQQERDNSSCPSRPKQVDSTLQLPWILALLSHAAHS